MKKAWNRDAVFHFYCLFLQRFIGEGNGIPLQYSCLENPMDGGALWAAVHGVTKGRTHWATSISLFTFMHWRNVNPLQCSCCCLRGHTESDMTEVTSHVHAHWSAISALSTSYLLNSPIQLSKYVLLFSLALITSLSCSQQTAFTLYWDVGLHLWTPSTPPPVFLAHSVRGFTWIQLHL